MKHFSSISEAYQQILRDLVNNPQYESAPRGLKIREILAYSFQVSSPTIDPIVTADYERNKIITDYTKKEFALYESGTRDVEKFAEASKFWRKIANEDGTVNSAYGYLIWKREICAGSTSWEWCMKALKSDADTRQAILYFNTPNFAQIHFSKDFPCTLFGQFFIRENKLHLQIEMRSTDCVKGAVYDLVWFCYLLHKAQQELKSTYPELQIGTYTHFSGSMHLYEKDLDTAKKMLFYS